VLWESSWSRITKSTHLFTTNCADKVFATPPHSAYGRNSGLQFRTQTNKGLLSFVPTAFGRHEKFHFVYFSRRLSFVGINLSTLPYTKKHPKRMFFLRVAGVGIAPTLSGYAYHYNFHCFKMNLWSGLYLSPIAFAIEGTRRLVSTPSKYLHIWLGSVLPSIKEGFTEFDELSTRHYCLRSPNRA